MKVLGASLRPLSRTSTARSMNRERRLGTSLRLEKACRRAQTVCSRVGSREIAKWDLEAECLRKRARNSDIRQHIVQHSDHWLIFVEERESFEDLPEGVSQYLSANRAALEKRAAYERGDCEWFKYTWPLHMEHHDSVKLISPYRADRNRFGLDEHGRFIGLTDTTVLFPKEEVHEDILYFSGLLNSSLLTFRYFGIGKLTGAGLRVYFANGISRLPVRRINWSDSHDVEGHNRIVELVRSLMDMKREYLAALSAKEDRRHELYGVIRETRTEIDRRVFDLYGIGQDEAKMIMSAVPTGNDLDP